MQTETAGRYRFDLPEGAVYVTVASARDREQEYRFHPKPTGMELTPMLEVHTGENSRDAENAPGFVKLRGRKYAISVALTPSVHPFTYEDGHVSRWDRQTQHEGYRSGYLNDNLVPLDWKAQTKTTLSRLAEKVADLMDAEHPEWRIESIRTRLEWECGREQVRINEAREEIAKAEERKEEFRARIETLTA